ncbi:MULTISPECIES: PTS sugar transporter subunit IIA [unclassified Jeotgalibaca]|uniref:PTS sugar transporter subunit IIA n=1 Tax=unclassified Jeotgalibaca TaxID=2621505 RepID=UPI003FD081F1
MSNEIEFIPVKSDVILSYENQSTIKSAFFQEAAAVLADLLHIPAPTIVLALEERERLSTTGFGDGLAIPHGKVAGLDMPAVIFMRLEQPVEWEALDDNPVTECFFLMIPASDTTNVHLKLLSKLAYHLADEEYQKKIHETDDAEEMKQLIEEMMQRSIH